MSWNSKNHEILLEMKQHKVDICALSETKRKGKGTMKLPGYVFIYSGVDLSKRASGGVGILVAEKYEPSINNIHYIDERILVLSLNSESGNINIMSVYAPDSSRKKEETDAFYEKVEAELGRIPSTEKVIILGDLNARVGNKVLPGIMNRFNEEHTNGNGEILIDFCARYSLRINNTFFPHKPQHKITWQNTRGQQSIIDFVISNRAIHPSQILDVRSITSANIGTDHNLVLCKLRMNIQRKRQEKNKCTRNKFNIESLSNTSTKNLYQTRIDEKIETDGVQETDDVEICWRKIKNNIKTAATEAVGQRQIKTVERTQNKEWYCPEIKELAIKKREAYIRYRSSRTPEERIRYTDVRNRVNADIKDIKRKYWEQFSSEMEHDLYGAQRKIWGMLRNRRKEIAEYTKTVQIDEETWVEHFTKLHNTRRGQDRDRHIEEDGNTETSEITIQMVKEAIKNLKNRKSPGQDEIPNELLKYGGPKLVKELTTLFNKITTTGKVPAEWKKSITIPVFKKGDKRNPENYRGITLLNSTMKLFTKILTDIIQKYTNTSEEQQGFRKNRSTLDAIYIIRQLIEKSIEYDKPVYMCFIDLTKAFDRVQLKDVTRILQNKHVPHDIVNIIRELNHETSTRVSTKTGLTKDIPTPTGIRQGDSLSPQLFNMIMDDIIEELKTTKGYKLTTGEIKIICYADDAVIMAESEDDLQRLLFKFHTKAKKLNMEISTPKTKTLVISKEPIRCKLVVEDRPVEQVMAVEYLGVRITSNQDRNRETREQTSKAARISGALRDIIWNNRHMRMETKIRIYKSVIRPIMTYGIETRADNQVTKNALRTAEMKILRNALGFTLRDRKRNEEIRNICGVQDIVRWGRNRRRLWNSHVDRMNEERIAKIARDGTPGTRRPIGRPPKRWRDSWTSISQEG